ncbi:hypothetical protein ACKWTF_015453 [Chironomus riparius]
MVHGVKQTKDLIISYASYPLIILKAALIIIGIRQVNPKCNASWQLVLMIMVIWFFTLRTIYVTKMIEFIILGIKKPTIKTLDELQVRNIQLLVAEDLHLYLDKDSDGNFFGLPSYVISDDTFNFVVLDDLFDPSYNGSLLLTDLEKQIGSTYRKMSIPDYFVPVPLERFHHIFGFLYPNLWNERMKKIIEGAICGGIIKKIFDKYTKSRWNLEPIDIDLDQLVMDFNDLILGFQISLFAYYAAFVILLAELVVAYIIKVYSDGWDSMPDTRLFSMTKKHQFSDNISSCSQSIYSSSVDISSIDNSPQNSLNIGLDVESCDRDSEQSMDIKSISCSIAFGDNIKAEENVKAERIDGCKEEEMDKDDESAGFGIKIMDFDNV